MDWIIKIEFFAHL